MAICCIALAVLYPGSRIAVISGTGEQATLVLQKIADIFVRNPNVLREINMSRGRNPVSISRAKGICTMKNGSVIESFSMTTFRGQRAKVLVVDEAPEVNDSDWQSVASPVLNTTRDQALQHEFQDYRSKQISITSACKKSNQFYNRFTQTLRDIADGKPGSEYKFACALDYHSSARVGITAMAFFENERAKMTQEAFEMEYGSIFHGAETGSLFPYEKTEECRVLKNIEYRQPNNCISDYVIGIDIAVSGTTSADNSVITVIKLVECQDGSYIKKVVCIQTFHGYTLTRLSEELRKFLVRFPRTIKVVFDHHGIGNSFPEFLSQPWTDPATQKEYPPLVMDTERSSIHNAIPLLRGVDANNAFNLRCVNVTTVALERHTIELPVDSRRLLNHRLVDVNEEVTGDSDTRHRFDEKEEAIFREADALQIEMGNIVSKTTGAGNSIIGTAKSNQHKDRYSSLSYALAYIADLEDDNVRKFRNGGSDGGVVLVDDISDWM